MGKKCSNCCSAQDKYVKPISVIQTKQGHYSRDIHNFYVLGEKIGEGGFAEVFHAISKENKENEFAVKKISKQTMTLEKQKNFLNEVGILMQLNHPNIVTLHEVFQSDEAYYLVFEHLSGGTLKERHKEFIGENKSIKKIMYQLLSAVAYLHEKGIVHRDIKPENIIFTKGLSIDLKLIDFGFACFKTIKIQKGLSKGTLLYMDTEAIMGVLNQKSDIWSIGVIYYILNTSYFPHIANSDKEMLTLIKSEPVEYDQTIWLSKQNQEFCEKLLCLDYRKRSSARNALESSFFVYYRNRDAIRMLIDKSENSKESKSKTDNKKSAYMKQNENCNEILILNKGNNRIMDSTGEEEMKKSRKLIQIVRTKA